jgi:hypothetical protein
MWVDTGINTDKHTTWGTIHLSLLHWIYSDLEKYKKNIKSKVIVGRPGGGVATQKHLQQKLKSY